MKTSTLPSELNGLRKTCTLVFSGEAETQHSLLALDQTKVQFKKYLLPLKTIVLVMILLFSSSVLQAITISSGSTGNWSAAGTWVAVNRTGTIAYSNGSTSVVGTGTSFTTQLAVGSVIITTGTGSMNRTVASITDNTHLTLTSNAPSTQSGKSFTAQVVPTSVDDVQIIGGYTVTITANAACASITFDGIGSNDSNTVTINSGISLTVSGAITIPRANSNGQLNTLTVGAGILNAGSIAFTSGGGPVRHSITISTGTVIVTSDITTDNTGASATITFTGTGLLKVGGQLMSSGTVGGTLTTVAGSTVEYNGTGTQTVKAVNYSGNLVLSGSGVKTMPGSTITIGGNFTLSGSATTTASSTLTVSGTTSLTGTSVLTLGAANILSNSSAVILDGGTFRTGATSGNSETVGTLALTNNSAINLGTGNHSLTFSASNSVTWTGTSLTINGWTGTPGASGTGGKIFFGVGTGTLIAGQLAKINFNGFTGTPVLLNTGELVPPLSVPILAITGTPLNHGSSCVGTPASPITYTITNTGVPTANGITVNSNNPQFAVSDLSTTSIAGGGGTSTYKVTFTPGSGGAQIATITVSSNTAGSNSPSSSLSGNGNALPIPTFTAGPASVCQGSIGIVYTTQSGMSSYNWVVSGGGSITSGGGSSDNSVTVTWNTAGPQSVSVSYTDANGCTPSAPTIRNVTVDAPISATTISYGGTAYCATGTAHVSFSGQTGGTFTSTTGLNINSSSGDIDLANSTPGDYVVTYSVSNGSCSLSTTANITINPLPVSIVGSDSPQCEGATVNLFADGGSSYSWTGPNGFTGTGPNVSVTNVTLASAGVYSVILTDANGCSATFTTTVAINPSSGELTASSDSPCEGFPLHLYASGSTSYLWTGPNFTSTDQNPVIDNAQLTNGGTYNVTNGCQGASVFVTVNPLPFVSIQPKPFTKACLNSGTSVYTTEAGMSNYLWNIPGGTFTGAGTNEVTVTWTSSSYQSITVNYIDQKGCTATAATEYIQFVSRLPIATITGTLSFCEGGSTILDAGSSTPGDGTITGFQWNREGISLINETSSTLTVNTIGNYTVTVTNSNTCSTTSDVTTVAENLLPLAPTVTPGSVCGGGTVNLSAIPGTGETIDWYAGLSGGGALLSGSNSYNPSVSSTTSYFVVSRNTTTGCVSKPRTEVIATVNPIPVDETITGGGSYCLHGQNVVIGLTSSESDVNYQLKFNSVNTGVPVLGTGSAISFPDQPVTAGTYTVVATHTIATGGCTKTLPGSAVITITDVPSTNFSPLATIITVGGSVNFTDLSSNSPASWAWTFTGGSISSSGINNPSVTYNNPGTYGVTLIAHNFCGDGILKSGSITVKPPDPCASGQIAQRDGATTGTWSSGTTFTISKPTGVVPGDVMIVNIAKYSGNGSSPIPSTTGWTPVANALLGTTGGNSRYGAILYRIVDGTEPASIIFQLGSNISGGIGSIIAFSGVSVSGSPFDVTPGTLHVTGNTASTTVNADGIMTVTNNAAVIFLGEANSSTWTTWNGTSPTFSEIMDFNNGSNVSVGAAWGILGTAGATGPKTATLSSQALNGGILIALRPNAVTLPTVNTVDNLIKCSGDPTSVAFEGAATTYYWTNDNTNIGLAAGGTGDITTFSAANVSSQQTATITVTPSNGTCTGTPKTFTITVIPKLQNVSIAPTGSQDFCLNSSGSLLTVTETGGIVSSRPWVRRSQPGGGIETNISNATETTYTPTGADFGPGTWYLVCKSSQACGNVVTSNEVTVTVRDKPDAHIGSNSPVCYNYNLNLTSDGGGTIISNPYSWTGPGGFVSTLQNPSINGVTPAADGLYSVKVTGDNGCFVTLSTQVAIVAMIDVVASSDSPQCAGSNLHLYAPDGPPNSWSWTGPNNFTSGSQTPVITEATEAATGTYILFLSTSTCGTVITTTDVVINPLPTPTITASVLEPCVNSTENVYTTQDSKFDYVWNISAGGTITDGGGTNSIKVTWTGGGALILLLPQGAELLKILFLM